MSRLYYTNLMWSVNRSQLKLNAPSSQELAYRTRRVVTALVRAALEAVGVVHEHIFGNYNKGYTSIRI